MKITKINTLDPRVWGVTIHFKVLKQEEVRDVNFKDGSAHQVGEFLVGDDTGIIKFSVWDNMISELKVGNCYKISEARLNVFNNRMNLTTSRKSELKKSNEEIEVDESVNMSEKKVKPQKKFYYKKQSKLF